MNGHIDTTMAGLETLIDANMSPALKCAASDTRCDIGGGANTTTGYKMHNGITFRLHGNDTSSYKHMGVDLNGRGVGADTSGVDHLSLCMNLGDGVIGSPGVYNTSNWSEGLRPGEVRLCENMAADGRFDWIYGN